MQLERQLKLALDESRLLILGAQVLFGFQIRWDFSGAIQISAPCLEGPRGLGALSAHSGDWVAHRSFHAPSDCGAGSGHLPHAWRCHVLCGRRSLPDCRGPGLRPFHCHGTHRIGATAIFTSAAFFTIAMLSWYGLELVVKRKPPVMPHHDELKPTPLDTQVDKLLTEARVIIPGAQAQLGFQLTATLMQAFQDLPAAAKIVHAVALCSIALTVILLMAPATLHRISFGGQDDPEFLKIGSLFVVLAPLPLAAGIALDIYVACMRALESQTSAVLLAAASFVALLAAWPEGHC